MMNERSIYKEAKEAFVESNDPESFVQFDSNRLYLERLIDNYKKPFKLIVIHGEPGVGKSMLLRRFEKEMQDDNLKIFYKPFFGIEEFKKELAAWLFGDENMDPLKKLDRYEGAQKTIVLDEAQLYEGDFLEYLRLLADSGKVRFILSMHQNSNENLRAKEHFETRIFDSIKIELPTSKEFWVYIQKRLMANGAADLAHSFDQERSDMVYRFCGGNLRKGNIFLYTLFDILEYFEEHRPSLLEGQKIPKSFIEMSAIHLGYIDA